MIEGAQTQIFLCAAKGIEKDSGRHFHDCKVVRDYFTLGNAEKKDKIWKNTIKVLDTATDGEISKKIKQLEAKNEIITISSHV